MVSPYNFKIRLSGNLSSSCTFENQKKVFALIYGAATPKIAAPLKQRLFCFSINCAVQILVSVEVTSKIYVKIKVKTKKVYHFDY